MTLNVTEYFDFQVSVYDRNAITRMLTLSRGCRYDIIRTCLGMYVYWRQEFERNADEQQTVIDEDSCISHTCHVALCHVCVVTVSLSLVVSRLLISFLSYVQTTAVVVVQQ